MQALEIEADVTVLNALYEAAEQIVECANDALLGESVMRELFRRIESQLGGTLEARAARGNDAEDEEDWEQIAAAAEEEDSLLELVRIFGPLVFVCGGMQRAVSCCSRPFAACLCGVEHR